MADSATKWFITPKFSTNASGTFTAGDPLGTNKVGMWECYSWAAYLWDNWNKNFTWNVAAIPAGPGGAIVAQANDDTFCISKHSKHPQEAWEVMKWLLEPTQMAQLTKSYGAIPGRKSLADSWLSDMKASNPNVDWDVFIEANNYAEKPNSEAWNPNYRKVWDEMTKAMDIVTAGASKDGAAVADALNAKVQEYTDEYWATAAK
jgi:multiple sugar transport system substrate-binding protein